MSKNFDLANEAQGYEVNNIQLGTISIVPGNTVTFTVGLKGPMNINNTQGSIINLLAGANLGPCTITSFNDHLDIVPSGNIIEIY